MTWLGRNDVQGQAGYAAEEEQRQANEQSARARRPIVEEAESAGPRSDARPGLINRIVGRIRRAVRR